MLHNRQQQPQVFIPLLHDTHAHVQLDRGLTAPVQACGNEQTTMTTTHDSKPMTGTTTTIPLLLIKTRTRAG